MPHERNILVLDEPGSIYTAPFKEHGNIFYDVNSVENADLIVFTGGADVSPELYGDEKHPHTQTDFARDKRERVLFNQGYIMAIPMVGICRGAQLLNVMNNGALIQHVNNHAIGGTHTINTHEGETLQVTSTHHQLIVPREGNLVAWATDTAALFETGGTLSPQELLDPYKQPDGHFMEPEVIYWPRTNSLGVQYHPEYMNRDSEGWKYFQTLLHKYIFRTT